MLKVNVHGAFNTKLAAKIMLSFSTSECKQINQAAKYAICLRSGTFQLVVIARVSSYNSCLIKIEVTIAMFLDSCQGIVLNCL